MIIGGGRQEKRLTKIALPGELVERGGEGGRTAFHRVSEKSIEKGGISNQAKRSFGGAEGGYIGREEKEEENICNRVFRITAGEGRGRKRVKERAAEKGGGEIERKGGEKTASRKKYGTFTLIRRFNRMSTKKGKIKISKEGEGEQIKKRKLGEGKSLGFFNLEGRRVDSSRRKKGNGEGGKSLAQEPQA